MPTTKKKTTTNIAKRKQRDRPLTVNQAKKVLEIMTALTMRGAVSSYLGKSFSGDRDLYTALGYTVDPIFSHYMARYERQDLARAIIDAPVRACWRQLPELTESQEDETEFESQWIELVDHRSIYHYLSRCDRLGSIGQYAVLLLGFDDGAELTEPVVSAKDLLYLMPYTQDAASIDQYDKDPKSERYGQVNQYSINMSVGTAETSMTKKVHWSRVIHVSEDNLSSDVFGTPRLQAVLNRLQDIEMISGGSSEMFWRGGFPGFGLKVDSDARVGKQDLPDLEDEMKKYIDGLQRYIRLEGITIQELKPQIADPSSHINILIDLIAAAVRIPKRILLGSERGELASSQDETNWAQRIDERRREHCEPKLLRPLIGRLIEVGVLAEPKEGYTVDWPDLLTPSDKEKAEVGQIRSKALKDYVEASGASDMLPPSIFLRHFLHFTTDEIDQIEAAVEQMHVEADSDEDLVPVAGVTR